MIHDSQNARNLPKKDGRNMYVNIRTMCSPGYHHVAISVCRGSLMTTLGSLVSAKSNLTLTSCAQVHEMPQNYCDVGRRRHIAHCFYDIYIYICIYMYI